MGDEAVGDRAVRLPDFRASFLRRAVVDSATGCWEWTGSRTPAGYGMVSWDYDLGPKQYGQPAHRMAWLILRGPLPPGLEIDHLCRNRSCVNPDHLEPVTHQENVRRGLKPTGERNVNGRKTHCPRGHPYSGSNLYEWRGRRCCRACRKATRRAAYERERRVVA